MDELKPCPFCGGKAHILNTGYFYNGKCYKCGCTLSGNGYVTEAEVIEAWNTRAERIEVYPFGMKVYICFSDNGESWEDYWYGIDSVHETYEGAKEAIERRGFHEVEERHNRRTWELKQGDWSTCSAWIEEWEVSK